MADNNRLHNGQFAPGNPGKPHGSAKNKLRNDLRAFISDKWPEFPQWFSTLKSIQKIDVLLALMPFAVSKLQSVAMTDSEGDDQKKASIDYSKLSESTLKEILQNTNTIDGND